MNERRFEGRFLCADLVRVDWLEGEDDCRTTEGVLEDISPLGACVQVEEHIPPGTGISIAAIVGPMRARFFGHVSYCVYRDYGYLAGRSASTMKRDGRLRSFVPLPFDESRGAFT